jgi:type IV pilus assembly protein PilM
MSLLDPLARLLQEPPPASAFEISEAGITSAQNGEMRFRPLEEGVLKVSPGHDNVQKPDAFAAHVAVVTAGLTKSKRRAALILPDYSARVQVLDFDSFPSGAEEQLSLIKFRVKKTVPFDVEAAVVSYHVQPSANKKVDVVAAIIALEIVARYEAPFRAAGLQPGFVTTSSLAALNLAPPAGVAVIAKLSGNVLSVMVQDGHRLKLARCVALESVDLEEILAVLHPTLAFVEDELDARADRVLLVSQPSACAELSRELGLPVEPIQSRFGVPSEFNAGLIGYMQGAVQ